LPRLVAGTHGPRQLRQPPHRTLDPGPNRTRESSPGIGSIAAACVDRAWTSSPAHVIVPDIAGPPHLSGVGVALRPDKPPRGASGHQLRQSTHPGQPTS
jgi:hypothetical protein